MGGVSWWIVLVRDEVVVYSCKWGYCLLKDFDKQGTGKCC